MPYINIRIGCKINDKQRKQLNEKTTHFTNVFMGKRREVTVVHIMESEPQQWATHSNKLSEKEPVGAYVDIKVTDGTNTSDQKAEMIYKTATMLKEIIGTIQKACYVVIHDIPANSWGYNGGTQEARATLRS